MDLDQLIVWTVCVSCGLLCYRSLTLPRDRAGGWVLVSMGILVSTLVMLYFVPDWAAFWGGALWVILVLVPLWGIKQVDQLFLEERYDRASQWALWLSRLHPTDGWVERVPILQGMALAKAGNWVAARQLINPDRRVHTAIDRLAVALWYSVNAEWEQLLRWLRLQTSPSVLWDSPELMAHYLRSLGEMGAIHELVQEWERAELRFLNLGLDSAMSDRLRLYVWAFTGGVIGVQNCLKRGARFYPPETQQFWLATAQQAVGDMRMMQGIWQQLPDGTNFPLQRSISWRLSQQPIHVPSILTPRSQRILSRLQASVDRQTLSSSRRLANRALATQWLIAANVLLFALEVYLGGSEDVQVLERLGAMLPERVWEGEWWRLGTATFLHFGVGHLVMNILGLYVLGISVEPALGIGRYLMVYFGSGWGSMLVTAIMARVSDSPSTLVVGASGAVMGLVGAVVAILLQSWRQHKARLAEERLRRILVILVVQTIFDGLNPQVCFVCHASGTILGLVMATLFIRLGK